MHAKVRMVLRRAAAAARDRGTSAVEYGLMAAAIAALIVGTVFALGGFVKATFDKTCSAISVPTQEKCVPDVVPDPGGGGTSP